MESEDGRRMDATSTESRREEVATDDDREEMATDDDREEVATNDDREDGATNDECGDATTNDDRGDVMFYVDDVQLILDAEPTLREIRRGVRRFQDYVAGRLTRERTPPAGREQRDTVGVRLRDEFSIYVQDEGRRWRRISPARGEDARNNEQ